MNQDSMDNRFESSFEDLLEVLRLRNILAETFLNHQGDTVFPTIPEVVGSEMGLPSAIFAWADSWGSYAATIRGEARLARFDADQWRHLVGDQGWTGEVVRLDHLDFSGRDLGPIDAIPLRDRETTIGFIGIYGLADRERVHQIFLLRNISNALRVFTITRVSELRRESMQRMTSEAFAKSEKRLRDFIEESKDTIYIADGTGTVTMINKAIEELLDVPKSEVLGHSFLTFCPFQLDREYFMERLAAEGFVRDFELTLQRSDGSVVFVTESATAVFGPAGEIVEIHGIIRDITERLESQRELWRTNLELADINEQLKRTQLAMVQQEKLASIGQLAAGIAHEINNPLGFLMSNMGSLRGVAFSLAEIVAAARKADSPEVEKAYQKSKLELYLQDMPTMFSEMDEGFRRIADIVKNLRSFARSGENEDRTNYDLNEGIKQTLIIARNETRYVADVETDLNPLPKVWASAGEINQVILNILVNAAQAIGEQKREEHGHIRVTTLQEGANIVLEIADDGPGIPATVAKRIFEPFFTTKEPGKGTGLGLSISWDIITRKHGGTLSFSPRAGGGTTFRITLPLEQTQREV